MCDDLHEANLLKWRIYNFKMFFDNAHTNMRVNMEMYTIIRWIHVKNKIRRRIVSSIYRCQTDTLSDDHLFHTFGPL